MLELSWPGYTLYSLISNRMKYYFAHIAVLLNISHAVMGVLYPLYYGVAVVRQGVVKSPAGYG